MLAARRRREDDRPRHLRARQERCHRQAVHQYVFSLPGVPAASPCRFASECADRTLAEGAIGGTAQSIGGPLAADGAIGRHFNADGALGGTAQSLADKNKAH